MIERQGHEIRPLIWLVELELGLRFSPALPVTLRDLERRRVILANGSTHRSTNDFFDGFATPD